MPQTARPDEGPSIAPIKRRCDRCGRYACNLACPFHQTSDDDDRIDVPRPSDTEWLRRLWSLSMHGHCPIWLGGQMQSIVTDALGVEAHEVDKVLGNEVVVLTPAEVAEIRERERAMMSNAAPPVEALRAMGGDR